MDTTDPGIHFDENGYCNHCIKYFKAKNQYPHNLSKEQKKTILDKIVNKIRDAGKNKRYDCLIGVSGGADSTYVAYLVKKLGLRPLAVHLDNGWDSELAVHNIEKTLKKLNIDLYTYVINWEEFKDLQLAFLKASTPDSEIPTDHAIGAIMQQTALKNQIKHIVSGMNFNTESLLPAAWSHGHYDWKYIKTIHRLFGKRPLKSFPRMGYWDLFYWKILNGVKTFKIFDFVEYDHEDIMKILTQELGWQYYGGKHYESVYTKFFQIYILPKKFGYDSRRAHLSNLICAGQISRETALEELKKEMSPENQLAENKSYVAKKLGLTEKEFDQIMRLPRKSFWDYPSHEKSWYFKFARKFYDLFYKGFDKPA